MATPGSNHRSQGVALLRVAALAVLLTAGGGGAAASSNAQAPPPLPQPTLPPWILQITPVDQVESLAQIRVRFANPVIPLEAIESSGEQSKLAYFRMTPSLPGAFRFVSQHMVIFEANKALPNATRVRVMIKAGFADLGGNVLAKDFAWTFTTAPIDVALPVSDSNNPWDLHQEIEISSNAAIELDSLRSRTRLIDDASGESIPLSMEPQADQRWCYFKPQRDFDPSIQTYGYIFKPQETLLKNHAYRLVVDPGLIPRYGNLPSVERYSDIYHTYAPLAFNGVEKVGGEGEQVRASERFAGGTGLLDFNNPIAPGSAVKNILVTPSAVGMDKLLGNSEGSKLGINPWHLAPDTHYAVTIKPGLTDTWGQKLGRTINASFDTDAIAADFSALSGKRTLAATLDFKLLADVVSLPNDSYQAAFARVDPATLVYPDFPAEGITPEWVSWQYNKLPTRSLPPISSWDYFTVPGTRNVPTLVDLKLSQQLRAPYGVLDYGMTARIPGTLYRPPDSLDLRFGRVNVTNLGLFAQIMPTEGLAIVHRLSDGAPTPNARDDFYVRRTTEPGPVAPRPCASGTTDSNGVLKLDAKTVRACAPWHEVRRDNPNYDWPQMLIVAKAGDDWTYVLIGDGGWYPTSFGWSARSPRPQGAFFSDRGLYQPGEKASFEAYAFYVSGDALHRDAHTPYALALRYPDGTSRDLGARTTNDFGSFSYSMTLPANLDVGSYQLTAKSPAGVEFDSEFRVAEFKAPNFKVSVAVDRDIAVSGDTVSATGASAYLFGQPVDRGTTHVNVSREQVGFTPHGWESFRFGRDFWPDPTPTVKGTVLDVGGVTDVNGATHQPVPVATDLPYPMSYHVELTTKDASNLAVASSASFTALPSAALIGVDAPWLSSAGKPLQVRAIVVDPRGALISGRALILTLDRFDWSEKGRRYVKTDVATVAATSGSAPATASFVPKTPGWYRVRVNLSNARTPVTESDRDVWVYGSGDVDWGQSGDHTSVAVQLDKPAYEVGDTVTALVKSPYADADLYFAVVRQSTLFRTMRHVRGGAPTLSFTVTPQMLPNAMIEVVLVRKGAPIESVKGGVESIVRLGDAVLSVQLDRRYLKVVATPARARLRPGDAQSLDLTLADAAGKPVRGQFTVMVADESVLQLNGYRAPDLVKAVYDNWPSSVESADNRVGMALVQPTPEPIDREGTQVQKVRPSTSADEYSVNAGVAKVLGAIPMRAGGGGAAAPVRVNFQQLAYFNGAVESDAAGRATVTFKTPDNLTTWRVLVVAEGAGGDAVGNEPAAYRFGGSDATFITTLPLAANALLPQFARPGDVFDGGVAINNGTGETGQMSITGVVTGSLAFFLDARQRQTASTSAAAVAGSQAFRFPMRAGPIGAASVSFHIVLGSQGDAFLVPFNVRPLDLTESVVETGTTTSSATIPMNVDPNVNNDAGGLQISMASTLLPEVLAPAKSIFDFDYLPFVEPLSSRVMAAADMQILATRYEQKVVGLDPPVEAADALLQLQRLQREDGGFAWWPGSGNSHPYLSGYVGQALGRAIAAKLPVDSAMIASLKAYLIAQLEDPDPYHWCDDYPPCRERMRFEALQSLAALGDARETHLTEIYGQSAYFDLVSRIELARYMTAFPAWKPKADAMARKLQELVYETGRYAALNVPDDLWWFDSITKGQAETVRLYIAQRYEPAIIDRAVRSLLALRRKGTWENTYSDAQALTALVEYAGVEPLPPDFAATAMLAGREVATGQIHGYRDPERDTSVAMADLPRNRSDLVLAKHGKGTLHYVVSYTYRLGGAQPGAEAGLLISREVRAVGVHDAIASMGLARPPKPFALPVGRVFDVGLTIVADHPVNQVVIVDPLPAGLEAVDTSFDTTPKSQSARYGSWQLDFQSIYHDRVVGFANYLAPGVYTMHYLVRTVTPGTFEWPGSQAFLEYAPEEFGRSASATAEVTPAK